MYHLVFHANPLKIVLLVILQNHFYMKKDVYFKGKATAFRITRALEPIPNWDLKALKNRHREMTNKFREIFLS